jgi:probable HAF family extracellular repeat protein
VLLASAVALGCADRSPTAPAGRAGHLIDAALPVVAVDATRPGAALSAARPPLALPAATAAVSISAPVDLGTLGICCEENNIANGVNAAGQVVGESAAHAFLWTPGTGMRDLGTLGGFGSTAAAINAAGQVVGTSNSRAFIWEASTGMRDLGTLGGNGSDATAINNAGEVVGSSTTASGEFHAFRWTAAGGMEDLSGPGGVDGFPLGINAAGQIVGGTTIASRPSRAFLWTPGAGLRELGTLGEEFDNSAATGVNDFGQVVGQTDVTQTDTTTFGQGAFFWQAGTGMVLLRPLPGDEQSNFSAQSEAHALNGRGQVVGVSTEVGLRAVLWTVRAGAAGAPAVDRLLAVALPPGNPTGLTGVWLRVRVRDPGDAGPWSWHVDWGDGTTTTTKKPVPYTGDFAFLRATPYTDARPHTITATATDPGGLTSTPATTTVP